MLRRVPRLRKRSFQVLAATMVVGILLAAFSLTAEAKRSSRFTDASLNGQYAYQSIGDDHVSVGLGIVTYDGDGETTRRVTVNAPDGMGGRRLLVFNSVGWYGVNADGTGTATYDNEISTGSMTRTTFDFVITEVQRISSRRRGAKLALAIYSVQREPGVTVSLVTNVQTRQSDLDHH